MALCATTALAGAVSRLCVRGARGRFGGGSGRYLVLCLSCFPLPAPRVPRCVWRAVPSGCPLPSLAGTPFHAVCAFRALGPVAHPVVPACPFRVCALALSRCPLPPRWVVWRAHLAWSRHWALVGPFHLVRAPPRVLPRSRAPSGVPGGGRSGPGSPLLGLGLRGRRPLAARPLERAARVPRPACPGCGRCGRGISAPAPQREPLRAGVARCGGGGRASPGGCFPPL